MPHGNWRRATIKGAHAIKVPRPDRPELARACCICGSGSCGTTGSRGTAGTTCARRSGAARTAPSW
jgi:hypothetical protein